jgi:ribosome-binding protein aMBF1 (putative translation factor)
MKAKAGNENPVYLRFDSNTHVAIPQHEYDRLKLVEKQAERYKKKLSEIFPIWHKEQRQKMNMSVAMLSKRIFVSVAAIERYEAGRDTPKDVSQYIHDMEQVQYCYYIDKLKESMKRGEDIG